jgi:hypothetical protein
MARSFRRTWVYVGREFLLSFAVAFLFFFFIFFVNQVLVMAEDIFSRNVPFWDVVRLVIYSLPWVVALSFPLGSLVGALMAVGRLTTDNEVLALGALGVPSRQILVPLLALGFAFTLVSFVMNDYFMPLGNIRFAEIYRRILYTNPAVELEPRSVKRYEDTTIVTGDIEGTTIKDLLIIDRTAERNRRIITAKGASLSENAEQKGVISLTLDEVFSQVSNPRERERYEYTLSREMIYTILLKNIGGVTIGGLNPSYQSSVDVWREIRKKSEAQAPGTTRRCAASPSVSRRSSALHRSPSAGIPRSSRGAAKRSRPFGGSGTRKRGRMSATRGSSPTWWSSTASSPSPRAASSSPFSPFPSACAPGAAAVRSDSPLVCSSRSSIGACCTRA